MSTPGPARSLADAIAWFAAASSLASGSGLRRACSWPSSSWPRPSRTRPAASRRPGVAVLRLRPAAADPARLRLSALGMNSRASALASIAGLLILGVSILGFTLLERNPASRAVFVHVGTSFLAFAARPWSIVLRIEPANQRRAT